MSQDHTFHVKHQHSGRVALTTANLSEALQMQYERNELQMNGADWQLWLVDTDGNALLVNTQA